MKTLPALLAASLLAGCALTPAVPARSLYDLGPAVDNAATAGPLAWRIADVTASPSAAGDGIAYRLAFQQAQRLEHYRDSLWAAPPAELLTQRLREQLASAPGCAGRPPALLTVHLDAFEQVFSSPTQSQAVLRVHATLWPAGASAPAQQQHWRLERPAATADADGAVRALSQAVDAWLPQLASWAAGAACR
ncbi:MAG: membrane integrity-associated transporter subunit PqiC [Pelomonas sp.]|nr:membrane integrity-associated transporter subunit PqiC [Roseateles sp.]